MRYKVGMARHATASGGPAALDSAPNVVARAAGLAPRLRSELCWIRRVQAGSRSDLHRELNLRKNTIGVDVARMIELGLLRESAGAAATSGRPGVLLEIDPERRNVLGVSIDPEHITARRFNLLGQPLGEPLQKQVAQPARLVSAAASAIRSLCDKQTLAVGVAAPGYIEPATHRVLFSAAWPDGRRVSLDALCKAAHPAPVVVDNQVNALASRWLLEHAAQPQEDHLLIFISDGRVGATLTVAGRPVRGALIGCNELGHMRLPVKTARCYCGETGCLERIFSSPQLKRFAGGADLHAALTAAKPSKALRQITELIALGFSNIINFARAGHVTLMSDMPDATRYFEQLIEALRPKVLRELERRTRFQIWIEPRPARSSSAAAVALGDLFLPTNFPVNTNAE